MKSTLKVLGISVAVLTMTSSVALAKCGDGGDARRHGTAGRLPSAKGQHPGGQPGGRGASLPSVNRSARDVRALAVPSADRP